MGGHGQRMQWVWFFFSSTRRHTRFKCDWSSDVCSSDLHHRLCVLVVTGDEDDALSVMKLRALVVVLHPDSIDRLDDASLWRVCPDDLAGALAPQVRQTTPSLALRKTVPRITQNPPSPLS